MSRIARDDTDWKKLPAINLDAVVSLRIILDEQGKLVKVSILNTYTDSMLKVKLEEVWEQEVLRQIRLVKWKLYYRGGKMIHKQRYAQFRFKPSK